MKLAILGSGRLALALASAGRALGHSVRLGATDADRGEAVAKSLQVWGGSREQAAIDADIILLATHWTTLQAFLGSRDWQGQVICDCTNPEPPDGYGLEIGFSTSGAETLAAAAKGAHFAKAFNHVYAEVIENLGWLGENRTTLLLAGDVIAKQRITEAFAKTGFDPVDAGDLTVARYLEPLAALAVQLARKQAWGPGTFTFEVHRVNVNLQAPAQNLISGLR
jgi:predicted dinucleotide-binding enzyme